MSKTNRIRGCTLILIATFILIGGLTPISAEYGENSYDNFIQGRPLSPEEVDELNKNNDSIDSLVLGPITNAYAVFENDNNPNARLSPISLQNYFNAAYWIQRNGVWSISLYQPQLRFGKFKDGSSSASVFAKVHNFFKNDWRYKGPRAGLVQASMSNQFLCHYEVLRFIPSKKPAWNLEPSRPYIPFKMLLQNMCN